MAQGFQRELELYGKPESYFMQLPRELQQKRDYLVQSLAAVGMKPIVPEGTYFLVADISQFSESCGHRSARAGCGGSSSRAGTGPCRKHSQGRRGNCAFRKAVGLGLCRGTQQQPPPLCAVLLLQSLTSLRTPAPTSPTTPDLPSGWSRTR